MTRVSSTQIAQSVLTDIYGTYTNVQKYSNQLSTGYQVTLPGDSLDGGTIQETHDNLNQIAGYQGQIAPTTSNLNYQSNIVTQGVNLIQQAQELATQGGNETVDATERGTLAQQVWQIRDQLVALANSTYQGKYVWSGTDSNTPPFATAAASNYTQGSTEAQQNYVYQGNSGTNSVQVGQGVSIKTNTPGDSVWQNAITEVQNLGRALEGFDSTPAETPLNYSQQTTSVDATLDQLKSTQNTDLITEQTDLGARINRLTTATSMLQAATTSDQGVLNNLQNADATTAATNFQQAEFALQAAMQVNSKVLSMSILNYL